MKCWVIVAVFGSASFFRAKFLCKSFLQIFDVVRHVCYPNCACNVPIVVLCFESIDYMPHHCSFVFYQRIYRLKYKVPYVTVGLEVFGDFPVQFLLFTSSHTFQPSVFLVDFVYQYRSNIVECCRWVLCEATRQRSGA